MEREASEKKRSSTNWFMGSCSRGSTPLRPAPLRICKTCIVRKLASTGKSEALSSRLLRAYLIKIVALPVTKGH